MKLEVKKICIIVPSFAGGGAEKVAVNLANAYVENNINTEIIVFNGFGPYKYLVDERVIIHDLNSKRNRYVFFRLHATLNKVKPTSIISCIAASNIALGFLRFFIPKETRIIFREASSYDRLNKMGWFERFLYMACIKFSYKRADKIIANSDGTKSDLISLGVCDENKVVVIGNPVLPVNFEELANQSINHKWSDKPGISVVLTVGRLTKLKNQKIILEAFKLSYEKNTRLRLIILGEGEELDNLKNIANDLALNSVVDFVSFKENPFPYYRLADIFMLASEWEGFGNVIVEAMACHSYVISTNCGGPRYILGDGEFGDLVPRGDVRALSSAVTAFLQLDKQEKEIKLSNAYNKALCYTVKNISNPYYLEL